MAAMSRDRSDIVKTEISGENFSDAVTTDANDFSFKKNNVFSSSFA
jgi:hypothetical protein